MTDLDLTDELFTEAINFLAERTRFGINLGLERIHRLLEALGNPHKGNVKYLHIGGTNGKGSTAAFCCSMLQHAGYKVGAFTSPHLHCYTERMTVNGCRISKKDVIELINEIKPILQDLASQGVEPPTEFEVNTAMALLYFSRAQVDYAVIEVGMGGEIDSTNVITPVLAVITNVALDHMDYLGDTVQEIAQVKSGIIKEGIPIITGCDFSETLAVIRNKAELTNSRLIAINQDFNWCNRQIKQSSQSFDYHYGNKSINGLEISLLGEHQLTNGSLAVTVGLELGLDPEHIRLGLASTVWPGRLEIVSQNPLIVLDGAHNTHGMQALQKAIEDYWGDKTIVAVLGMLADKERAEAMARILPHLSQAVITKVPSPRAGDWQNLAQVCQQFQVPCSAVENVGAACEQALQEVDSPDKMLLVTGSLYMLAAAREYILANLK